MVLLHSLPLSLLILSLVLSGKYHGNVDADFAQRDDGRVSASFLVVLLSPGLLKASLPLLHLLPMLNTLLSITLYVRLSGAGLSTGN